MSSGAEKRKFVRVPVELRTQIIKDEDVHIGTILNIGEDGVFVKTDRMFEPNELVQLLFQLPHGPHLKVGAKIIWGGMIQGPEEPAYGMGIHFERMQPDEKDHLKDYIRSLLKN